MIPVTSQSLSLMRRVLPRGIFGAEVLAGQPRREEDGVLTHESVAGIAPEKLDAEDPEQVRVGGVDVGFLEGLVAIDDGLGFEPSGEHHGGGLDLGIAFLEGRREGRVVAGDDILALGRLAIEVDPVDAVGVRAERVDARLEANVEQNEGAGGQADGQGQDVEERMALVLDRPPEGQAEIGREEAQEGAPGPALFEFVPEDLGRRGSGQGFAERALFVRSGLDPPGRLLAEMRFELGDIPVTERHVLPKLQPPFPDLFFHVEHRRLLQLSDRVPAVQSRAAAGSQSRARALWTSSH
jgi:hypothetical protein